MCVCVVQGIGYPTEVGEGRGAGFNVNIGWEERGVGDGDYMAGRECTSGASIKCVHQQQQRARPSSVALPPSPSVVDCLHP